MAIGPLFGQAQLAQTFEVLGTSANPIFGDQGIQLLKQILVATANRSGGGGGGGGTVTEFIFTDANGIDGVVTNPTTTPTLEITLKQITPETVHAVSAGTLGESTIGATGAWFTGGTSTTTKPQFLIEPTGTTSNNWSTSGTGIGLNASSGFAGNLMDLQVNGTSKFIIDSTGSIWDRNNQVLYFKTADGTQAVRFPYNDNKALTALVALDAVAGRFRADANGAYVSLGRYLGFTDSEQEGTVDTRITRGAAGVIGLNTTPVAAVAVASTEKFPIYLGGVLKYVMLTS